MAKKNKNSLENLLKYQQQTVGHLVTLCFFIRTSNFEGAYKRPYFLKNRPKTVLRIFLYP